VGKNGVASIASQPLREMSPENRKALYLHPLRPITAWKPPGMRPWSLVNF
jgi:hypothetical protein